MKLTAYIFLAALCLAPVAQADDHRRQPDTTLLGFCKTVQEALAHGAEDQGLQATATFGQVQQYWIAPTSQQVRASGRIANLDSMMLFKLHRPNSCTIEDLQQAGDFAKATLILSPTAKSGVIREQSYELVEAKVKLIRQQQQWYLVDFIGPLRAETPKVPEAMSSVAGGTPAATVGEFMAAIISALGPGGGGNLSHLGKQVEDLWVSSREARRNMGQLVAMFSMQKPESWQLESERQQASLQVITINLQTTQAAFTPFAGKPDEQGMMRLNLVLINQEGRWLLQGYQP